MKLPPEVQERIAPKYAWIRLLNEAPSTSWFYSHDETCVARCERANRDRGYVYHLRASTIHHVAVALASKAEPDGTEIWAGFEYMAAQVKRGKVTVVAAVKHLEAKQLIFPQTRGGSKGNPRTHATVYVLTTPPAGLMAQAGLGPEIAAAYDWFTRPPGQAG